MDFFEKLGDTITETGRDVSQKVTDMTEITKLRMDIRSKEESVRKQYLEIGKQYYELHKDDEEPIFEEVALIKETLAKIEELKGQIAERKGRKICSVCGAANEIDALYCNKCGTKCEEPATEETDAETIVADASAEEVVEVDVNTEEINTETEES